MEHFVCPSHESLRLLIIILIWQVSQELIRMLRGVGVQGAQHKKMPEPSTLQVTEDPQEMIWPLTFALALKWFPQHSATFQGIVS